MKLWITYYRDKLEYNSGTPFTVTNWNETLEHLLP
jgi:hypothetical protein